MLGFASLSSSVCPLPDNVGGRHNSENGRFIQHFHWDPGVRLPLHDTIFGRRGTLLENSFVAATKMAVFSCKAKLAQGRRVRNVFGRPAS